VVPDEGAEHGDYGVLLAGGVLHELLEYVDGAGLLFGDPVARCCFK
jgi:hypothetical protein